MGRRTAYGRAFKVSEADVRAYERTRPPRGYRPNPMGVTHLARVNGRGAYAAARSARSEAAGKTRGERMASARSAMRGTSMKANAQGHRARFVSGMKKNPGSRTRARRAAAYQAAKRRGLTGNSATRSALRKVPFTSNERRRGARFQGSMARPMQTNRRRMSRNPLLDAGQGELPGEYAERLASGKPKRARTEKQQAAARRNIKKAQAARKRKSSKKQRKARASQYKRVPTTRRKKVTKVQKVKGTKRVRYRYGKYTRAKLTNPRTGRRQYSYMYRAKGGRLRKIPYSVINPPKSKGHDKSHAKYMKARRRAADRMLKQGGPFVANKKRRRKGKMTKAARRAAAKKGWRKRRSGGAKRRSTKRSVKRTSAKRRRKGTKSARSAAAKKGWRKRRSAGTKRRSTKRRSTKRASAKRRRKGKGTKAARSAAAKKGWRKRRRSGTAKRKGGKRKSSRRMRANGRKRQMKSNRRRSSRRRMTANQMKSLFKKAMTKGLLVTAGFLTHRLLTSLVSEHVVPMLKGTPATAAEPAALPGFTLSSMEKPLVGLGVLAVGLPLTALTLGRGPDKEAAVCVGAGMVASFFQTLVVSVLQAAEQPRIASQFAGYSNSMAYALRGRRGVRGLRGLGQMERRANSIMPRYAQVGQFRQAAAGMGQGYRQAAAGTGRLGEYFTPTPVGEYFVPQSVQGVGQYEPAGPLAMQAAAGFGQTVDDGIRPDSNLDTVLDLAESAAGLRGRAMRGMGEYFTAAPSDGGMVEQRVPPQSQWIPNGPLWAGTLGVKDTGAQSELPAGILAGPGGNGILSGQ